MTIYEYAKLNKEEKELLVKNEALFLEHYIENENTINVYYLNEFFVEITIREGKVIYNLPYKRGYKLNKSDMHAIEKRNTFYNLAA